MTEPKTKGSKILRTLHVNFKLCGTEKAEEPVDLLTIQISN